MLKRVMIIGAHPDDIELGAGGLTYQLLESGVEVLAVDITDGELTPMGDREIRQRETAAASAILGLKARVCLDEPNRVLQDTVEARTKLAIEIRRFQPEHIITHLELDAHPDHSAAYQITKGAVLLARIHKIDLPHTPWRSGRILKYPCYHLKTVYNPSILLNIDKTTFEKKLAAIKCYESQFVWHEPNQKIFTEVENNMRYFGSMLGTEFAEPFYTETPPGFADLQSII